jgi:acyl-CoA thioesterase
MNEGFENSAKAQQSETDEKPVLEETSSEMFDIDENIEADKVTPEDTPEEHIEALEEGDYITAECTLDKTKTKVGFNIVEVKKDEELVALFKGVVYRTNKDWE